MRGVKKLGVYKMKSQDPRPKTQERRPLTKRTHLKKHLEHDSLKKKKQATAIFAVYEEFHQGLRFVDLVMFFYETETREIPWKPQIYQSLSFSSVTRHVDGLSFLGLRFYVIREFKQPRRPRQIRRH